MTRLTMTALLSVCGGETMEGPMMGITRARPVRRSSLARAGAAAVVAAGLALTGAAVAPAAGAKVAPAILQSLDCRSVSQCVAVGVNTPVKPTQLEGDNWNGKSWVRVAVPEPPGAVVVRLNGVSCPARHPCVAVGKVQPKSGGSYPIGEVWHGTYWSATKAAAAGTSAELTAVSCPTIASCFAVGDYAPKGSGRTVLIEHWNGKAWAQLRATAPRGSKDAILHAVSCAAWDMCVAVGDDRSGQLAERWNGHAWAVTRPPTTSSESLWGVSCPAATRCFAVGGDDLGQGALVDQWNGKSWTRSYPAVASDGDYPILKSVSCSSATACLAVGNNVDGVFTERLTDQGFVPDTSPFIGGTPRYVLQVRCLSATRCVALASAWPNSQSWRSEAEFWNGSSWQTVLTS
jgi:hypothetical protein